MDRKASMAEDVQHWLVERCNCDHIRRLDVLNDEHRIGKLDGFQ